MFRQLGSAQHMYGEVCGSYVYMDAYDVCTP